MNFIHDDFLLDTQQAKVLFHDYAEDTPIIDYHCPLQPEQVSANKQFRNLYEVWLAGDHYKWRAMRSNGINERYCTGDASDWEKFEKWCETLPYALRNPLYHWTTDDPIHDLEHHKITAADKSFKTPMLPTWRRDRAMAVENALAYNKYLDRLAVVADININSFDDFGIFVSTMLKLISIHCAGIISVRSFNNDKRSCL